MLSERIYKLGRENGLSQEQLAEKIGVSRQAISKWESGTSTPELEKLLALSECFQVTLDELIQEDPADGYTCEGQQPAEASNASKDTETKAGIGLCLAGAICLILSGLMMLLSPGTAEQLNTASAITLNGSGIVLVLCVLAMIAGLVLILRKK